MELEKQMDDYQKYIHISKYARFIDKHKRRETWQETVERYVNFWEEKYPELITGDYKAELFNVIYNLEVMPSMRALMSAGKALSKDNAASYNCWASAINHPKVFDELFYLLMVGGGVGFSVERQYIAKLPEIAEEFYETDTTIVVQDSRIGWASALREVISLLYAGKIPKWDVSKVRPAGARLKTFGGRASGPAPLESLFRFMIKTFKNAKGRKLNSIECHDIMCKIADTVIVGSVRRAAMISFSNLTDTRLAEAKTGEWWIADPQRALSNNSVAYTEKPDLNAFSKEWRNQHVSRSGERGIVNKVALKKKAISCGREYDGDYLLNPCQPSYATVLTPNGISTIGKIKIGDTIWSGKQWTKVTNKVYTGIKDVSEYKTTTGKFIGTENHRIVQNGKKIEVKDADKIDWNVGDKSLLTSDFDLQAIMDGLVIGDGSVHKASDNLIYLCIGENDYDYFDSEIKHLITKDRRVAFKFGWEIKTTLHENELPKTFDRKVPDRFYFGNEKVKRSFLRGLFTANGSIAGNRITLKQSSGVLIGQVQEMLSSLGIHSYITTNKGKLIKFSNGEYQCKKSYDLNITSGRSIFRDYIGFIQKYKQEAIIDGNAPLHLTSDIKEVIYNGKEEVFDITVEADEHTYWTGGCLVSNCGEAILRDSGQACNLSEVVIRPNDTLESLKRKVKWAAIIGTLQSTLTDFRYLRKVWKDNVEDERLLGISLTGIMDHPVMSGNIFNEAEIISTPVCKKFGTYSLNDALKEFKQVAEETNTEWAVKLGINKSKQKSLLKPSGTVSQLVNCSSGIHPRMFPYYIRRVRQDKKDPLSQLMINQGIPYVEESDKYIFSFYVKSPENAITSDNINALQQLELWKTYQEHWCDGNPSQTIYYTDDEYFSIADWIWKNWDSIGGLSFFPKNDHVYETAPYESISKEQYEEAISKFPKTIDWEKLKEFEKEDTTTSSQEVACSGGQCEI